jgi:spermidine/putrescine transport system permease protein
VDDPPRDEGGHGVSQAIAGSPARESQFGLVKRMRGWIGNPWGRPRFLVLVTWGYILWSIAPVLIAIQFSFNNSRSLSVWHGFTLKWYTSTNPNLDSVLHSAELRGALSQSIKLAGLDVLIATPIGLFLALGLARWRGRGAGASNFLMLFPLVTPEIVMGVSLLLLFTHLLTFVAFGTVAQVLGHVTFSISYVVVIVRGRLFSIGRSYEEAAADLGAAPPTALYRVLLPLLLPAVVASAAIVFAISIDDFVISQWLSSGANSTTVPMEIYAATRATPEPSTDGIATVIMLITLLSVVAGLLVYRLFTRGETGRGSAVDDVAGFGV